MKIPIITAIVLGSIAALALLLYLPRLFAWFGSAKPQKRFTAKANRKIAVVVPARNESVTIGALFDSIKKQSYPKEDFELFVVVKDQDDKTITMAKDNGFNVHVAQNQKCKGDALDSCIVSVLNCSPDKFDAFLIVDADCVLDKHFLEEMNNAMESGAKVIQGKRLVKNRLYDKGNSLVSDCNGLIWTIIDQLGNRYKADHNITGMTIGTGIMLDADLLKELGGWVYRQTLTEDIELMYDCVAKGIKTYYTEYALIFVEESPLLSITDNRRTRWMTGVTDSRHYYAKKVAAVKKTRQNFKNVYFTNALQIVYFYIGSLYLNTLAQGCYTIIALLFGGVWLSPLVFCLSSLALIYLSFFVLTLACLISDRKSLKLSFGRKILVLFAHPIFYMGYIKIISRALAHKNTQEWVCIEHTDFVGDKQEECK